MAEVPNDTKQTTQPDPHDKKEPTTSELLEKFLEQQSVLIEKFDTVLEKDEEKKKDKWDVISSLSGVFTFFSSVVIAVVGVYFTNTYRQQDVRITEAQTVEKFLPSLNSQNIEARKGALLAVYGLQNHELAARLAASYAAPDNIEACETILKTVKDDARDQLVDALVDALKARAEIELSDTNSRVPREELLQHYERIFQLMSAEQILAKKGQWYLASIYTGRGNLYKALKKYNLAGEEYKAALSTFPDWGYVFESIGLMYGAQGNFDESIKYISTAIEKQPNVGKYYADLGYIYSKKANAEKNAETKRQDLAEAEAKYIKAVEIDPEDISLHFELAYFYIDYKMPAKAKSVFEDINILSDNEMDKRHTNYQLRKIVPQYFDVSDQQEEISDKELPPNPNPDGGNKKVVNQPIKKKPPPNRRSSGKTRG